MNVVKQLDLVLLIRELEQASEGIDLPSSPDLDKKVSVGSLRVLQRNLKDLATRDAAPAVSVCSSILTQVVDDLFENIFGDIPYNKSTERLRARAAAILKDSLFNLAKLFGELAQAEDEGKPAIFYNDICEEIKDLMNRIRTEKMSHHPIEYQLYFDAGQSDTFGAH